MGRHPTDSSILSQVQDLAGNRRAIRRLRKQSETSQAYFSLHVHLSFVGGSTAEDDPRVFQQTKRPFFGGGSSCAVNPIFHGSHAEHCVNVPTARIT